MTSKKDVIAWIQRSNSFHSLQSVRAKLNKRLKLFPLRDNKSPFSHIPLEKRREVLSDLFVEQQTRIEKVKP